jgi:hypothetical protein
VEIYTLLDNLGEKTQGHAFIDFFRLVVADCAEDVVRNVWLEDHEVPPYCKQAAAMFLKKKGYF